MPRDQNHGSVKSGFAVYFFGHLGGTKGLKPRDHTRFSELFQEDSCNSFWSQTPSSNLAEQFWTSFFHPIRSAVIKKIRLVCLYLKHHEAEDMADEVVFRLWRHLDVKMLSDLPPSDRARAFYGFSRKVIFSVLSDTLKEKGLVSARAKPAAAPCQTLAYDTTVALESFHALAPEDQQILKLKVFEKLPYRQIQIQYAESGRLVSIQALKMRVSRARRAWRAMLAKQE